MSELHNIWAYEAREVITKGKNKTKPKGSNSLQSPPPKKVIVLSLHKSELFCSAAPEGALALDHTDSPL